MKRNLFPFAAVCGMEKPKEAILLTLVNPFAGGLLLSGEKGTGKSTLVRSARELLADARYRHAGGNGYCPLLL